VILLSSFHSICRILSGEDWNDVMQDCMQLEDCYKVLQDITVAVTDSSGNVEQVRGELWCCGVVYELVQPEVLGASAALQSAMGCTCILRISHAARCSYGLHIIPA